MATATQTDPNATTDPNAPTTDPNAQAPSTGSGILGTVTPTNSNAPSTVMQLPNDGNFSASTGSTAGSGTGIINQPTNTPQQTQPAPPTPTVDASNPAYTAAPYTVTPDQTVEGRTQGIINLDSPLMQQAQTRAKQLAQSRGMVNSSMAAGAEENAVLDAAVPIAQQDAATYNQAMTNTQNAVNTSLQATLSTLTTLTNTQLSNQEQTALANLDASSKQSIALLGSQNAQLLQANTSASNMFQEVVKNIAAIAVDATLSPDAKAQATQSQLNLLNQGLQTVGGVASTAPSAVGNLNLAQYFQQGTVGGGTGTQPGPGPATPGTGASPGPGPAGVPSTQTPTTPGGGPPPAANAQAAGGWPAGSDEALAIGYGITYNAGGQGSMPSWTTPDGITYFSGNQDGYKTVQDALRHMNVPGFYSPPQAPA